jgi:hypothetical protein
MALDYHPRMSPDDVHDFTSFLDFVEWLASDRAASAEHELREPSNPWGPAHGGWENTTIESFLGAAAACSRDHAAKDGAPAQPSWREFARFLAGGKVYE